MVGIEKIRFEIVWLDNIFYNFDTKVTGRDYIEKIDLDRAISTACYRLMHRRCPNHTNGFVVRRDSRARTYA
jgi:hypothetical protein